VVGFKGIFLIETKNWKDLDFKTVFESPHFQIERCGVWRFGSLKKESLNTHLIAIKSSVLSKNFLIITISM
jgi:hypothetical protein